jgi:NAD(P)-dependent dehydrogenase (short-subunit alcohol dehydrogenase family)
MNGLTMTMAHELGPAGIRVLGVAPTTIDTPGIAELRKAHDLGDGVLPGQRTVPPLGRYGVADDVARVVLFCASDLSSLMTGVTLPIDAGVTLA